MTSRSYLLELLEPDQDLSVQLRSVQGNQKSEWSNKLSFHTIMDTAPPTTPSTLTGVSSIGVARLTWDGLSNIGQPMEQDLDRVEVYISDSPTFSSQELVDNMVKAGTVTAADYGGGFVDYNQTYYFRSVAIDHSGNASAPSQTVSVEIQEIVATATIIDEVDGAMIVDGTIDAADKVIANSITGLLIRGDTIEGNSIKSNTITAGQIQFGAISGDKIRADAIDGKTIDAVTLTAGTIYGTDIYGTRITTDKAFHRYSGSAFNSTTLYPDRIEIGNSGSGDPIDEIRMFNNGAVTSLRHRSGDPGSIVFSLYSGSYYNNTSQFFIGNTAYHDSGTANLMIGRGTIDGGGPRFKFISSYIQVRNSSDSGDGSIRASSFDVSSYAKYKQNIEKVSDVDYRTILKGAGLKKWNLSDEFVGLNKIKARSLEKELPKLEFQKIAASPDNSLTGTDEEWEEMAQQTKAEELQLAQEQKDQEQYGIVADDLPDFLQTDSGYSIVGVLGFLWEAVKKIDDRLETLEEK